MLGLDTYVLKQLIKWVGKAKTEDELKARFTNIMWSLFAIHLLLAALAGLWLYKISNKKKKTITDLILPSAVLFFAFVIPSANEKGEEITNVPSSTFLVAITIILITITFVVWFTKSNPEKKEEEIL